MNPLLINLISTLTGANQTKANPDYNNPNSPTYRQPYVSPSFWSKLLSPETASYANQSNIAGQESQAREQQQHDIAKGITASDFAKVQNASTTPLGGLTPAQGAVLFPQGGTAPELQNWNETTPRNILGLPSKEATTAYQAQDSASRKLASESQLGLPESSAWENYTGSLAGGSGNVNRNLYNNVIRPYIPSEAQAEGTGAQVQGGVNSARLAALPDTFRQILNEAKIGAGMSDVDTSNLQTLKDTKQSNIRTAAREASYAPTMSNPLTVTKDGRVVRNPFFGGLIQSMNAKLGDTGGTSNIPVGNGLNIISSQTPDMGSKSSAAIPQRPVRGPISSVESTPQGATQEGHLNPVGDLLNALKGTIHKSQPFSTKYWQQQIDNYNSNPTVKSNLENQGIDLKYLQDKLKESQDFYANH